MSLYSHPTDYTSHKVRLIISRKELDIGSIVISNIDDLPESIKMQPGILTLPLFKDKQHVISQHAILSEFLDDRYPFPPMMPVIPLEKAHVRLFAHRIYIEWYACITLMEKTQQRKIYEQAQQKLLNLLVDSVSLFEREFINGEAFSIADCTVLPILWRLPYFSIHLPEVAAPIRTYAEQHFAEDYFKESLTSEEAKMHTTQFQLPT